MKKEESIMNYSPLRYPGGKSKLAPFISILIKKSDIENPVYIEPFAGGAGVALYLLFNSIVDEIVINDYDKAIYSMWRALLTETDRFVLAVNNAELNVDEWKKQKKIYTEQGNKYSFELGFAAFYLNRTNRSGILSNAGPIGGFNQTGNYRINARFNKPELIKRIKKIAQYKSKIHLYNKDIRSFLKSYLPKYQNRSFVYFDPPYYEKGESLYKNYFTAKDHQEIFRKITNLNCPWIVTYDDVPDIIEIYSGYVCKKFDLIYSLANNGKNSEIMFVSDNFLWPTEQELQKEKIDINLRGEHNGK